jgi:hypothetical protein
MYAEFSYDLVPGDIPNDRVLLRILACFAEKPNGERRRRCDLLSDTFICEIENTKDYEATNTQLHRLRNETKEQFNYTFSLRSKGDPIRIRSAYDAALARQIVNG